MRDHRAYIFNSNKPIKIPIFKLQHMIDFRGNQFRNSLTQMMNTEAMQQAFNGVVFCFFHRFAKVFGRLFTEPFQRCDFAVIQPVYIGQIVEPSQGIETFYIGAPKALDIHRIFGNMMDHPLQYLGFTLIIDTAPGGFLWLTEKRMLAYRTIFGEFDHLFGAGSQFFQRFDNVRDHVSSPFDQHFVTQTNVSGADKVFVVQRYGRYSDTSKLDRLNLGYRGNRPDFTHLEFNVQ